MPELQSSEQRPAGQQTIQNSNRTRSPIRGRRSGQTLAAYHGTQSLPVPSSPNRTPLSPSKNSLHQPNEPDFLGLSKALNPRIHPEIQGFAVCVGRTLEDRLRRTELCHEGESNVTEKKGECGRERLTERTGDDLVVPPVLCRMFNECVNVHSFVPGPTI